MNKQRYFLILSVFLFLILGAYSYLHQRGILPLPGHLFYLLICSIICLFIFGGLIMLRSKDAILGEKFAQRFLIMTSFHFLAILSLLLLVWYRDKADLKAFSLQFLVIFVVMMIVQSVLLVGLIKEKK